MLVDGERPGWRMPDGAAAGAVVAERDSGRHTQGPEGERNGEVGGEAGGPEVVEDETTARWATEGAACQVAREAGWAVGRRGYWP